VHSDPPLRRWHRVLGIQPSDSPRFLELGSVMSLTTFGDFLVEGAVTAAFLARIGPAALPAALATRAVAEVIASLVFDRLTARLSPRRALRIATLLGSLLLPLCALLTDHSYGVWTAYVLASVLGRVKVIHFGVLALAELPGARSLRVLPLLHAGGRLGAMLAGPVVLLLAPAAGVRGLLVASALVYGASAWLLRESSEKVPVSTSEVRTFAESEVPPSSLQAPPTVSGNAVSLLLHATLIGAVALAIGRLALVTQSGAILARNYSETELARVLGIYFLVANAFALFLQVAFVGRWLARGRMAFLNSGWSLLYLVAQLFLSLAPPSVLVALGARMVESELRNSIRTPVASLLYEAMPPERRAFARTLVIGVAVPLASVVGGLLLMLLNAHPLALSSLGIGAAVLLTFATWAQNRYFRAAKTSG
jgi:hypothetical protein